MLRRHRKRKVPMREMFPGYYARTEEEIKRLWDAGRIVLDSNLLLNLYRYSKPTRLDFLKTLRALQSQLWLPYQTAEEFQRNRLERIYEVREKSEVWL